MINNNDINKYLSLIFSLYFIAIASFLVYNSFIIMGIPFVYAVFYLAVAVIAVYCSYMYSKSSLSFWELPTSNNGSTSTITHTKGGLSIYIVYIVALSIRLVINFLFIGSDKLYSNSQPLANDSASTIHIMPLLATNSTTTLFAFIATDILLIIGAGLVVGRNARIIKHQYQERKNNLNIYLYTLLLII